MPYIKQEDRKKFEQFKEHIKENVVIETKGELEYLLTLLLNKYMSTRSANYSNLHDCAYSCIHAGEEFKRRRLDEREDWAIRENGDVL